MTFEWARPAFAEHRRETSAIFQRWTPISLRLAQEIEDDLTIQISTPEAVSRKRTIAVGFIALVVAGLVAAELLTVGQDPTHRHAPNLPDQVLSGKRVTLASLQGKPALINFWASWCPGCRQEAPELKRFDREMHGQARLVGVDWGNDADAAKQFISEAGWRYPVLRDPSQSVGLAYGLTGLPTTYVLDANGEIVRVLEGPQTVSELRAGLAAAR